MLKAIVFDFDYTLGDSTNGIALSINYALQQLGYDSRNTTDIRKTIGLSLKETFLKLTACDDMEEAEKFAELFKEEADRVMVNNTELYSGVKGVLQKLKAKGYKIAIVTTKFHYRIEQILSKFDSNDLIDIIVGAEDVKVEKPNPEGLLLAIEHLAVMKEEVIYVGDSIVDAQTAENAKTKFLAVLTGTTTKDDFDNWNKVYLAKDIDDVFNYIVTLEK